MSLFENEQSERKQSLELNSSSCQKMPKIKGKERDHPREDVAFEDKKEWRNEEVKLIAFVNSKAGAQNGEEALVSLKELLGAPNVFDVTQVDLIQWYHTFPFTPSISCSCFPAFTCDLSDRLISI